MTIEERIAALEVKVAKLQSGVQHNGEVPTPPIPGWNPNQSYGPAQCGKCGLKLGPVMGYVCPQGGNCPCGLGGISCGVTGDLLRNT